jgi:hypothetical protein
MLSGRPWKDTVSTGTSYSMKKRFFHFQDPMKSRGSIRFVLMGLFATCGEPWFYYLYYQTEGALLYSS